MINHKNLLNGWDRIMAAITFAEAGEPGIARDIMEPNKENHKVAAPKIKILEEKRLKVTLRI